MNELVTIGVYGRNGGEFISDLQANDVRLLVDVRQRRGVRGPDYAWANSLRLQAALRDAGIAYQHRPELAPTTELRHLQYREDDAQGVGKRSRVVLAADYTRRYLAEVLGRADLSELVAAMPAEGRTALFCVERDARACHRSLIADRLHSEFGLEVVHV